MGFIAVEKLDIYRLAETLADHVWQMVTRWAVLAKDTVGKQLIRAVDSIGANIAEGAGRGSPADNRRFLKIARGSLVEVRFWLRRAFARGLMSNEDVEQLRPRLDELAPRLNAYIKAVGKKIAKATRTANPK